MTTVDDPVKKHFARIERVEWWTDIVSWLAILAFCAYVFLHLLHSAWDASAKLVFVLLSILAVAFGYWFRFAAQPPADRRRRRLLIRDGTGAQVSTESQSGYWNNAEPPSVRRLLFNLAENTFFVPRMLQAELGRQIARVAIFAVGLLVSLRFGTAEVVELFAVLLVFSELLLGKRVRMVWTQARMKRLHADILAALKDAAAPATETLGRALYLLGEYEYIKGRAGYRAPDHVFERLNPQLTKDWEVYRDTIVT